MALSAGARRVVIMVATVFGVVLTANLGAWQLRRAAQKIALQDALESRAHLPALSAAELARNPGDADAQHYRVVHLRGTWLPERNVFLENRQMDARVGFYLVTPLQLEGRKETVLVQRGWAPRDMRDRTLLPTIATPAGLVDVTGHIAPPPSRLYEFAPSTTGVIRQNLDLGEFAAETGLSLAPLSVLQADSPATAGDGLLRQWPRPAVDVQKHYGYAFQWFALCALMTGLYVWFQLVRPWLKRHTPSNA
jgi:surfeit locus 1 family protein